MGEMEKFRIFVGYDQREAVAYEVCKYSIERRATIPVKVIPLKHRDCRSLDVFRRPWQTNPETGFFMDGIDGRPFSTEFAHTRFLVPQLCNFKGWALFMDCDMIFQTDIAELTNHLNDKFAVMCVKHNQNPHTKVKMDGMEQAKYYRKNWSSFMLFNCSHPSNKKLDKYRVHWESGRDLHAFCWLKDHEIGSLGVEWNWLSGDSDACVEPKVIHYTYGGPWFGESHMHVAKAENWIREHQHFLRHSDIEKYPFAQDSTIYELKEIKSCQ